MAKEVSQSRSARLKQLRQKIHRRASFLEHKSVIDYRDVYQLIREFFKEYLDQNYEFTITELRDEVKKTYIPVAAREEVFRILTAIEKMEYTNVTYSREELLEILKRFRGVVGALVKTSTQKNSFIQRIRSFLLKEEERPIIITELPVVEDDDAPHVHVNILIERLYLFLERKNLRRARKQYDELCVYYAQLPEPLKQEFLVPVNEAYESLVRLLQEKR